MFEPKHKNCIYVLSTGVLHIDHVLTVLLSSITQNYNETKNMFFVLTGSALTKFKSAESQNKIQQMRQLVEKNGKSCESFILEQLINKLGLLSSRVSSGCGAITCVKD